MQAQGKEREVSFTDERQPLIVFYDIELDDAELDPYQFRIYQRIARRCAGQQKGSCTESLEAMAAACKMSRPTVIRAVKVLIQRGMIRRESRQGSTSFYALTDKKNWISYTEWQAKYRPEPGKPESQVSGNPVNQRVRGGKPESQGVSTTESGGGSVVYTKNTNEEYKRERDARETESSPAPKLALVSSVSEPTPPDQPFSPNDDFCGALPAKEWTIAERFVLKSCGLWDDLNNCEKPIVETNWKTKQAVVSAGRFVAPRLDVKARIGGTPKLFLEYWHDEIKRTVTPRPDYVVEQWEAYDRWLINNYETHRRLAA